MAGNEGVLGRVVALLILEASVTIATAYQHHSEARWEVSAAFFGTLVGFILARLVIWAPFAAILFAAVWLRRPAGVGLLRWILIAAIVEVGATFGSLVFHSGNSFGIFYHSFGTYATARLAVWVPLMVCCVAVLRLRSSATLC